MKTLLIAFLLFISANICFAQKPDSVYLCMGSMSRTYHNTEYCKGLKRCSTMLFKVSLNDAVNKYHRTGCHYCYNAKIRKGKHEIIDRY